MFGQRTAIYDTGRRDGNTITVHIGIEPVGGRATCGAKEMVEPTVDRTALDGAGIVNHAHRIQPVPVDRLAFLVKAAKTRA